MKLAVVFLCIIGVSSGAFAQVNDGVLIRCGASDGHAFYFKDDVYNPEGSRWVEDTISNGKIILVKLGEEWDIQFDDASGSYGFRQDGADVVLLTHNLEKISVGAFHSNYVNIYTFDFNDRVVAWSTNKTGAIMPKVATYSAACE